MNGVLTEREWRRKGRKVCKRHGCYWGAQCLYPSESKQRIRNDWSFRAFLLLLSIMLSVALPLLKPIQEQESFAETEAVVQQETAEPRRIGAISYHMPQAMEMEQITYTTAELARGQMLLLDHEHPLPDDAPVPNTYSIAIAGKGMIPVRNLQICTGRSTIEALKMLFDAMRQKGIDSLMVWQGTLSRAQQRVLQLEAVRQRMYSTIPDQAVAEVWRQMDAPGTGELIQEYTVELRFRGEGASAPDMQRFETTWQGQQLLQTAWRHGFIRSNPNGTGDSSFRFRYVGKAHATAMTYLDLTLQEYLVWMHKKGVLTIEEAGTPRYLIVCKPITGTHIAFSLPQKAICEASLDNMGYAIVACTIQD